MKNRKLYDKHAEIDNVKIKESFKALFNVKIGLNISVKNFSQDLKLYIEI